MGVKEMDEKKNQGNGCGCNSGKCIKGVTCDVQNCVYHAGENQCHAGTIAVGPHSADCSANTSCATFKPKEH